MELHRQLEKELNAWRVGKLRVPILIRGARQVGKSYLIESFGKKYFNNIITINFELNPEYKTCFQTLDPIEICNAIEVMATKTITQGETLLFLDEIQDCPDAIRALRYFKEKMPGLHVIGAGSLLELVLNQATFRMPVGRVLFLYLYPLSFKEFLQSCNPQAIDHLEKASVEKPLPEAIHNHLMKQLKIYLWLGGMPAVLQHYEAEQNLQQAQIIQAGVLETYERDFSHYHTVANPIYLRHCFRQVPLLIGQQIKYNKIDPDSRSRELKDALDALESANVIQRIHATAATGIPLDATVNDKKFKLNFVDVGLVKRANKLDVQLLLQDDFMLQNQGALTEQFVGQELLAYSPSYEKAKLYFWARDGHGNAEVDYIISNGKSIFPLEVKSGKVGRLKSLQQFLIDHNSKIGVRVSTLPLSFENNILSVPLYMMSELQRLLANN